MVFVKGDININREGRPKEPDQVEDIAKNILKSSLNAIKGKVKELSTTQNIKLISVLLPYSLPKLQSIIHENVSELDNVSDEDLNNLINRLLDNNAEKKEV